MTRKSPSPVRSSPLAISANVHTVASPRLSNTSITPAITAASLSPPAIQTSMQRYPMASTAYAQPPQVASAQPPQLLSAARGGRGSLPSVPVASVPSTSSASSLPPSAPPTASLLTPGRTTTQPIRSPTASHFTVPSTSSTGTTSVSSVGEPSSKSNSASTTATTMPTARPLSATTPTANGLVQSSPTEVALRSEISRKDQEIIALQYQLNRLKVQPHLQNTDTRVIAQLQSKASAYDLEHDRLVREQGRVKLLEEQLRELQAKYSHAVEKNSDLKKQAAQNAAYAESLSKEVNDLRRKATNEHELEDLRQQVQNLQSENQALQSKTLVQAAMNRHIDLNALPPLPDGSSPSIEALSEITIAKLERENQQLSKRCEELEAHVLRAMKDRENIQKALEKEQALSVKLSKETETIGEYVALYQRQKQAMLQTLKTKDEFIEQLKISNAHAREQLRLHGLVETQPQMSLPNNSVQSNGHITNGISPTPSSENQRAAYNQQSEGRSNGTNNARKLRDSTSKLTAEPALDAPPPLANSPSSSITAFPPSRVAEPVLTPRVPEWVQAATSHGYYAKFSILSL
eukprot:m.178383 g.178383  ORF g.178383 m.178383 type:complete len:576 (+) comp16590_c0_seq6:182-1909(+)